ncbi:hypothetical protein EYF80_046053 [Liparis tanakae]|uniref:Uncharacterized protein n=1 Tax=Liparis tanakae TaxID=230148 RepID=A0A4Z2FSQ5_9TELE|nr:hypothetical protein EYF80_046053 [Liparis tanakae]
MQRLRGASPEKGVILWARCLQHLTLRRKNTATTQREQPHGDEQRADSRRNPQPSTKTNGAEEQSSKCYYLLDFRLWASRLSSCDSAVTVSRIRCLSSSSNRASQR